MRRIALTLIATLLPLAAQAAPAFTNSPLARAKHFFEHNTIFECVNPNGDTVLCKANADTSFKVFPAPDHKQALVIVSYLTDPTGNGVQTAAILAQYTDAVDGWTVRNSKVRVGDVPSKVKFGARDVSFVATTMKPGDARCCPTGRKTISLAYNPDL